MSKIIQYKVVPVYAHKDKCNTICFSIQQLLSDSSCHFQSPSAGVLEEDILAGFTIINAATKELAKNVKPFYRNISEALADCKDIDLIEKQTINPTEWGSILRYTKQIVANHLKSTPHKIISHIEQRDYSTANNLCITINILDENNNVHMSKTIKSNMYQHPLTFKREVYRQIQSLMYAIDNTHPNPITLSPEEIKNIQFF